MDDLVAAAEGRIFVSQAVQDMRVRCHDAVECKGRQRLDIAPGQILEGRLVAETPRRIARVTLALAEDGEVDLGHLERL